MEFKKETKNNMKSISVIKTWRRKCLSEYSGVVTFEVVTSKQRKLSD